MPVPSIKRLNLIKIIKIILIKIIDKYSISTWNDKLMTLMIKYYIVDSMLHLFGVLKICPCDYKPADILKIDIKYNLMIRDFGISKKLKENSSKFGYNKNISGTIYF